MNRKLCVINGLHQHQKDLEQELLTKLKSTREDFDDIQVHTLRDMKIQDCCGCWDCWVKTPGKCLIKDQQEDVLRSFIQADQIIFMTPITLGFLPSLIKKSIDRIIPSIHPYIRMHHGESHHRQRYNNSPDIEVVLIQDDESTDEDISLITKYFDRVALNVDAPIKHLYKVSQEGGIDNVFTHM